MVLLLSMVMLIGCSNQTKMDEANKLEDVTDANEDKEVDQEEVDDYEADEYSGDGVLAYQKLMEESALKSKYGYLALDNYFSIEDKLKYIDLGGADEEEGSSFEEVKEAINSVVKEDQYELIYDESGNQSLATFVYRNPEHSAGSYDDTIRDADISFYFLDDGLIYSSIAPGPFTLDIERVHLKEDYEEGFISISELEKMDPDIQIFSLGQIRFAEDKIYQIMVPTREDEEDMNIIANYIHLRDGEEIASIHRDFNEVSQSLPSNSYMVFANFLENIFSMLEED